MSDGKGFVISTGTVAGSLSVIGWILRFLAMTISAGTLGSIGSASILCGVGALVVQLVAGVLGLYAVATRNGIVGGVAAIILSAMFWMYLYNGMR